ncbi:hypothetical protein FKM82_005719 [Ascaphus truei]
MSVTHRCSKAYGFWHVGKLRGRDSADYRCWRSDPEVWTPGSVTAGSTIYGAAALSFSSRGFGDVLPAC